jgi:hypothetical protein
LNFVIGRRIAKRPARPRRFPFVRPDVTELLLFKYDARSDNTALSKSIAVPFAVLSIHPPLIPSA